MNGPGNKFLAGTSFSVKQDGGIGGRNDRHLLEYFFEGGTSANNVLEVIFGADLRFQVCSLVLQLISRCIQPTVGQCIVDGQRDLTANLREQIQICLGEAVLFPTPEDHGAERAACPNQWQCGN